MTAATAGRLQIKQSYLTCGSMSILIADSGSTKCEWCLLHNGKRKKIETQGISPYFLDGAGIAGILEKELIPYLKKTPVDRVFFYGTGCKDPNNRKIVRQAIRRALPGPQVEVTHDLMGA